LHCIGSHHAVIGSHHAVTKIVVNLHCIGSHHAVIGSHHAVTIGKCVKPGRERCCSN
jgi:hypothetical protein